MKYKSVSTNATLFCGRGGRRRLSGQRKKAEWEDMRKQPGTTQVEAMPPPVGIFGFPGAFLRRNRKLRPLFFYVTINSP